MFKTVTTIILTVIVVLFSIQNFDHVSVDLFFGKPINIRLIFVIAISGTVGYLTRHFIGIDREEKLKRQVRLLDRRRRFSRDRKPVPRDRDNIFEDEAF